MALARRPPDFCEWGLLPADQARDDKPPDQRRGADRDAVPQPDIDEIIMRAVHRIGEGAEAPCSKACHLFQLKTIQT